MIDSIIKRFNPSTGIVKLVINLAYRFINYDLSPVIEKGKFTISFWDEENPAHESLEYIDMNSDFEVSNYMIYSNRIKDKINVILIPDSIKWEIFN